MNPENLDPNTDPDIVKLDHILKAVGANLVAWAPPERPDTFETLYKYVPLGKNGPMGRAFEEAATDLVTTHGGKITGCSLARFNATFDNSDDQFAFMKAFSVAAQELYNNQAAPAIKRGKNGFVLGDETCPGIPIEYRR